MKLLQTMLGKTPETLNAIDMVRATSKLILSVMHSIMFRVANVNQSVIATPAITVDDGIRLDPPANNGLQSGFRAVRHDLCIDFTLPLEKSKDGSLAARPTSTRGLRTEARTEVRFINFNFTRKWRRSLTFFSDTLTDFEKDQCHRFTSETAQLRDISGIEIHGKVAQQLAEFLSGNSGTRIIAVSTFHSSSLAPL